jgi:uncharacterized protein (TIGR03905 family)
MSGTCASEVTFEVEDGIVKSLSFVGGCDGNLQAISKLVPGMRASDVIRLLEGIKCGRKPTSCPDQLAKALMRSAERK